MWAKKKAKELDPRIERLLRLILEARRAQRKAIPATTKT